MKGQEYIGFPGSKSLCLTSGLNQPQSRAISWLRLGKSRPGTARLLMSKTSSQTCNFAPQYVMGSVSIIEKCKYTCVDRLLTAIKGLPFVLVGNLTMRAQQYNIILSAYSQVA